MEPELLLLDEPASSLDPQNALLLEAYLEQLHRQGIGLVVATHQVDFAWRWRTASWCSIRAGCVPTHHRESVCRLLLLRECGLEQPLLYQVGKRLGLSPVPRRIDEI